MPRARAGHLVDVVLIGASTGGPAVVSDIVTRLPAGFGPAVVIAQHMPASFTGPFAHRLNGASALEVREVTGTEPLRPGTVYIGRGDADVVLRRQGSGLSIRCVPAGAEYRWHPSVDRLVASALAVLSAQRLLGVLMTGMGDDGADQMTRLMQGGGRTIAESEESAVVWGMPGELVKRSGATCVLSATRVVSQIENWC